MKRNKEMKIIMRDSKIITRKDLFEEKELFHKELAKISFEEKIKILIRLQEIANTIHKVRQRYEKLIFNRTVSLCDIWANDSENSKRSLKLTADEHR